MVSRPDPEAVVCRRVVSSLMSIFLAMVCTAASAIAGSTEEKTVQRAARPGLTSFIWTNDEIDMLRESNIPISFFGPTAIPAVTPKPLELVAYDRTKDPGWYAQQAAILRAEIEERQAELIRQQEAIANAKSLRQTDSGVAMGRGNAGISTEAGVENLRARVHEAQVQLDALADLAQRNGIAPGVLRG